jgi:hypothetical protein
MFELVNSKQAVYYYGHVDVKLGIARLVSEYLVRISPTERGLTVKQQLDTMIGHYDADLHMAGGTQLVGTYGGALLLEFGKIFRALYVD